MIAPMALANVNIDAKCLKLDSPSWTCRLLFLGHSYPPFKRGLRRFTTFQSVNLFLAPNSYFWCFKGLWVESFTGIFCFKV